MFCPDGQYNTAAALWLQVPEASVRSFFHDPVGGYFHEMWEYVFLRISQLLFYRVN